MLIAANVVDDVRIEIALAEEKQSGRRVSFTPAELNCVAPNVAAAFLSKQIDVPGTVLRNVEAREGVHRI